MADEQKPTAIPSGEAVLNRAAVAAIPAASIEQSTTPSTPQPTLVEAAVIETAVIEAAVIETVSKVIIHGSGFGGQMGSVRIDGLIVPTEEWSDSRIVATVRTPFTSVAVVKGEAGTQTVSIARHDD